MKTIQFSKILICKDHFNVEKVGREKSINLNHSNLIINLNQKYSESIQFDTNHTDLNQPIPADLTYIISIHDSDYIHAIHKILASPVHSPVHASLIFTYGSTGDPTPPPHDTLTESVTPRDNPRPNKNPPNAVPNVPADPDSDPSSSDFPFSESSDSSDNKYYKQRQHAKKDKRNAGVKRILVPQSKNARILQPSY